MDQFVPGSASMVDEEMIGHHIRFHLCNTVKVFERFDHRPLRMAAAISG
jgi:hypothetical protein